MAIKKNTSVKHGDKEYNYYRITRTVGHEWKNGQKVAIKKQFIGSSKGNAEQKYKQYLEDKAADKLGKELEIEQIKTRTFGEYAEEFTYQVLPTLNYAKGTKEQYAQKFKTHISKSHLMSMPLSTVTAKTIQGYYNGLAVSDSVISGVNKWMAIFYKWIALNEYGSNVLSIVTLPRKNNVSHKDIIVWEPDEISAIFAASSGFRYQLMIYLMYYAGLRISECLGLRYDDISNGIININRQYYRGDISAPKNNSSRQIPAHKAIIAALQKHKSMHEKEMRQNKYSTEYIFTTSTGNMLDYHNVKTAFLRFYKRNGIHQKKLHAYRATFCTELCRAGVPLEVASKLMGHKSIEVTARHYALVKKDVQIDAINQLPNFTE